MSAHGRSTTPTQGERRGDAQRPSTSDPASDKRKGKGVAPAPEPDEAPPAARTQPNALASPDAYESLFHAIDGFIRANCNFESSVPVNAAITEIGTSESLQDAFMIPLQRQLFNLDAALRWVLFLTIAPERAEKEGDSPFAPGSFSCQDALTLVSQVYDIGVQESIWEHFEDDDEDDEDDEEEDEEGDSGVP
jgi:hypothetical protein